MSDAEFSVWLEHFEAVLAARKDELGVSDDQVAEMAAIKTSTQTALNEKQTAEDVRQAKTADYREKRAAAVKKVAYYSKIFKADEAISDALIEELGLDSSVEHHYSTTPQMPLNVVVEGFSNGINSLKWKANGNRPNTVYIIEARKETETNFAYAGTTTKTKFDHKNQKPGDRIFYRVRAMRNDEESPNSNEAVVY